MLSCPGYQARISPLLRRATAERRTP